jgi:hypothetical protein
MSIRFAADQARVTDACDPVARLAFIGNVHRLLLLGYRSLDNTKYQNANENLLTQTLAAALRRATEDMRNPRWTSYFSIHEKQKQDDGKFQGNSRLELDIVFERTQRGAHPHFVIEAKRLGRTCPIGKYLGAQGLGAFISGEYANEHDDAGMLGYVQSKTLRDWSCSLESKLAASPRRYSVEPNGTWQNHRFRGGPTTTFRSRHARSLGRKPITVYHTLLDFNQ